MRFWMKFPATWQRADIMPAITDEGRQAIRAAMADVPHGQKGRVVADLMARFGVSCGTIYRHAHLGGTSRRREPERPEYREWVEHAVALANRASPPMALKYAIRSAVAAGDLPPEALDVPVGTLNRIRAEMNYAATVRRTQKLHADYPLQAVQFDGSHSDYLIAERQLDDDDWLLKIHRKKVPLSGYKNKPVEKHRQRVVYYALWDMCTGLARYTPTIAKGENALDAITSVIGMLSDGSDPARPMAGVPGDLWSDNGALVTSNASRDLLGRLGIAVVTGKPGNKERQGGVERAWRTLWSAFERTILAEDRTHIALSEITARLATFEREMGQLPARQQIAGNIVTRVSAWTMLANRRPADKPLRQLPTNALATLYREDQRHIDRNGIVRFEGTEYECREWHNRWVTVRQPLDGREEITLECQVTGERVAARPYQPRKYGDVRGQEKTALDILLEAPAPVGGAVYSGAPAASTTAPAQGNLVTLQARLRQAADLDNPLDASRFASLADAMAAFTTIYGYPLAPVDRAAVEQRIEAAALNRAAVAELASELLVALSPSHRSDP